MTFPIGITYLGVPPSPALSAHIERQVSHLEHFAPRLQSCAVTVRRSERRHKQGNRYLVNVRAKLPGAELCAGRTEDQANEDAYLAANGAIEALRRQFDAYVHSHRDHGRA